MSKAASTTFTSDTELGPFVVGFTQGSGANEELISFQFDGTWDSATLTLYLCNEPATSPKVFTAMNGGAFTDDMADVLRLPTGAEFKVVCSGASKTTSVYAAFRGEFKSS